MTARAFPSERWCFPYPFAGPRAWWYYWGWQHSDIHHLSLQSVQVLTPHSPPVDSTESRILGRQKEVDPVDCCVPCWVVRCTMAVKLRGNHCCQVSLVDRNIFPAWPFPTMNLRPQLRWKANTPGQCRITECSPPFVESGHHENNNQHDTRNSYVER